MPFISFKSTTVKRSYDIITLATPLGMGGALRGKIVSMVYLVVTIIELSSETWHTIVNYHVGDRMMLYRLIIDDNLVEISHTCHLGLEAAAVPTATNLVECGAVGRDQGRFQ